MTDQLSTKPNDEGADTRKDSVRQARDTPCDALSSNQLLPCPFCGAAPEEQSDDDAGLWIGCMNRECVMPYVNGERNDPGAREREVARWNMRMPTEETVEVPGYPPAVAPPEGWPTEGGPVKASVPRQGCKTCGYVPIEGNYLQPSGDCAVCEIL